jgi:hypothetical protein
LKGGVFTQFPDKLHLSMRNRNLYKDLQVTTPEPKLTTPRFPITYWNEDGTYRNSDYVIAMPFRGKNNEPSLKDLIIAQEELLKFAVFETAAIGSLVCDPRGLDLINKIAKMLVVVGKPERGIDVLNLLNAGDYLQIGQIFLSENYNDDNIIPADFQPGRIARIHKMDFMGKLIQFNQEKQDGAILDLIKAEPELAPAPIAMPELIPAQINTPLPPAVLAKLI